MILYGTFEMMPAIWDSSRDEDGPFAKKEAWCWFGDGWINTVPWGEVWYKGKVYFDPKKNTKEAFWARYLDLQPLPPEAFAGRI